MKVWDSGANFMSVHSTNGKISKWNHSFAMKFCLRELGQWQGSRNDTEVKRNKNQIPQSLSRRGHLKMFFERQTPRNECCNVTFCAVPIESWKLREWRNFLSVQEVWARVPKDHLQIANVGRFRCPVTFWAKPSGKLTKVAKMPLNCRQLAYSSVRQPKKLRTSCVQVAYGSVR